MWKIYFIEMFLILSFKDVAASTRNDVQNILNKLEEDKCNSPESLAPVNPTLTSVQETPQADVGSVLESSLVLFGFFMAHETFLCS